MSVLICGKSSIGSVRVPSMSKRTARGNSHAAGLVTSVREYNIAGMMPKTDWRKLHGEKFSGQSVLVTGGAGFIGSHIATALNELGVKVTVLDDLSGGGDPKALPSGVDF